MTKEFDRALTVVLEVEGWLVNSPNDPGGLTKYGISQRSYPNLDIGKLTRADAAMVYQTDFWTKVRADYWVWPLCLYVFDAAVNQGPDAAVRMLQMAASTAVDGVTGPNTREAVAKKDPEEMAALYMAQRALRYTGTRNFDANGRGWFKRLFIVTAMGAR